MNLRIASIEMQFVDFILPFKSSTVKFQKDFISLHFLNQERNVNTKIRKSTLEQKTNYFIFSSIQNEVGQMQQVNYPDITLFVLFDPPFW